MELKSLPGKPFQGIFAMTANSFRAFIIICCKHCWLLLLLWMLAFTLRIRDFSFLIFAEIWNKKHKMRKQTLNWLLHSLFLIFHFSFYYWSFKRLIFNQPITRHSRPGPQIRCYVRNLSCRCWSLTNNYILPFYILKFRVIMAVNKCSRQAIINKCRSWWWM